MVMTKECLKVKREYAKQIRAITGGHSVFPKFMKDNSYGKARSLFLQRGRGSPRPREAVGRGATVLYSALTLLATTGELVRS